MGLNRSLSLNCPKFKGRKISSLSLKLLFTLTGSVPNFPDLRDRFGLEPDGDPYGYDPEVGRVAGTDEGALTGAGLNFRIIFMMSSSRVFDIVDSSRGRALWMRDGATYSDIAFRSIRMNLMRIPEEKWSGEAYRVAVQEREGIRQPFTEGLVQGPSRRAVRVKGQWNGGAPSTCNRSSTQGRTTKGKRR